MAVSVLPTPLVPTEQEHADRRARIAQVGPRRADALRDPLQRVRLADDRLFHQFLQIQDGLDFVGDHAPDGDAGPGGHRFGDGLRIDARVYQRVLALQLGQLRFGGRQLRAHLRSLFFGERLRFGSCRIFGCGTVRRSVFGGHDFRRRFFICDGRTVFALQTAAPLQGAVQIVDLYHQFLFLLPAFLQSFELGPGRFLLPAQLLQLLAVVRPRLLFALKNSDGHVQLFDATAAVLDGRRGGGLAEPDAGAGGVQQAHRLVGQLPPGDVTVGELHRIDHGFVQDADLVVLLERLDQPAHHFRGGALIRFLDLDHLEPAGEGGVLLEVLFVLGPGRGGDGPQFAACQRRFEQVGGIALAGAAAGTDHLVRFVDEQDDGGRRRLDFVDHRFQPVFEFPLDACAGLQQPQVEGANRHVLQRGRDVARGDAQGETFHDRRLADSRLAGQNRIVLAPTGENIDQLPDLRVAAEHRIDFALAGTLGEIDRELIQGHRFSRNPGTGLGRSRHGMRYGCILARTGHQVAEILLQGLRIDLGQPGSALAGQPGQIGVAQQGQQKMSAADRRRAELDRRQYPRFANQLNDRG